MMNDKDIFMRMNGTLVPIPEYVAPPPKRQNTRGEDFEKIFDNQINEFCKSESELIKIREIYESFAQAGFSIRGATRTDDKKEKAKKYNTALQNMKDLFEEIYVPEYEEQHEATRLFEEAIEQLILTPGELKKRRTKRADNSLKELIPGKTNRDNILKAFRKILQDDPYFTK